MAYSPPVSMVVGSTAPTTSGTASRAPYPTSRASSTVVGGSMGPCLGMAPAASRASSLRLPSRVLCLSRASPTTGLACSHHPENCEGSRKYLNFSLFLLFPQPILDAGSQLLSSPTEPLQSSDVRAQVLQVSLSCLRVT